MAKCEFRSVDDYIAAQPAEIQPAANALRAAILRAAPEAEESISYQMPAYKWRGKRLLYFAVWKQHVALYGATSHMVEFFGRELAKYEITKGTIRFPSDKPLPVKLIERIAKFRLTEIAGS